jgi:hypothetical protein
MIKFMKTFWIVLIAGSIQYQHATAQPKQDKPDLIYSDDFETDLSNWVIEQGEGGTAEIVNGQLDIVDEKGCTIWFKEKLKSPVMIEYEAIMIDSGGRRDRVSDLNCFWMAIDPEHPDDIFADTSRGGRFPNYHPLRLYYVGYGGNDNSTTRFRRYPGGGERPVLPEHDLNDPEFLLQGNRTMKIQLIADGEKIQFWRDGELIYDFVDEDPYLEGWFGFRTVRSHLRLDNFKVYRLSD